MRKARRVYGRFTAPTLCVAVLLAGAVSAQANDRAVDDAFWNTVKSCRDAHEVNLYLSHFPGAGMLQRRWTVSRNCSWRTTHSGTP